MNIEGFSNSFDLKPGYAPRTLIYICQAAFHSTTVTSRRNSVVRNWPGRAKEDVSLFAEKLPFAELRDGKFRRHPQRPVMADSS